MIQNALLESYINSRITVGVGMQVDRDLRQLLPKTIESSIDAITKQPLLYQNMATNTYGSMMVPYDISLPLSSILAGKKTMVKMMIASPLVGLVDHNRHLVDQAVSNVQDHSRGR